MATEEAWLSIIAALARESTCSSGLPLISSITGFSAECTTGMVCGLTPLKHYGTRYVFYVFFSCFYCFNVKSKKVQLLHARE